MTPLYVHLRLFERFSWLTPEMFANLPPHVVAVLEAHERLRQHEEAMMYKAKY